MAAVDGELGAALGELDSATLRARLQALEGLGASLGLGEAARGENAAGGGVGMAGDERSRAAAMAARRERGSCACGLWSVAGWVKECGGVK